MLYCQMSGCESRLGQTQRWATGGIEPLLDDVLSDLIARLLMRCDRCDGLAPADLWQVIAAFRRLQRERSEIHR